MSETRKDEVREALWRVIRAAPDDLQDALSLALSPDVPLTSRQIADALLSLHAPEAGEACQHDFAASTETPVLGLLPVARCTKCGAGSIDRAPRPAPSDAVLAGVVAEAEQKLRRAINGLRVTEHEQNQEVSWATEIEDRLDTLLAATNADVSPLRRAARWRTR